MQHSPVFVSDFLDIHRQLWDKTKNQPPHNEVTDDSVKKRKKTQG